MKTFKIPACPRGVSAYPLRVVDVSRGDPAFQIVPAYAYGRDGQRWYQDSVAEVDSRELAEFMCAALNQADLVVAAPALFASLRDNASAWHGEEGSVQEEHAELIAATDALIASVEGVK